MDSRTQFIYRQDEILWAGGYPGLITKIGFHTNITPSPQVMHNFQVKLKNTTQTSLTNWVTDGMTTVYSGDYQVGDWPRGWQMITLQTPFYYDTTNLLVEICFDNDSYSFHTSVASYCCPGGVFHDQFDGESSSGCNTSGGNILSSLPWFRMYMTPVVQPVNNLLDITTAANQSNCFDATQTITVAGSGSTFTVKNDGNVNLIAGQNILVYPGASVQSGGYLHGYITTTGQYCGSLKTSLVTNPEEINRVTPAESKIFTNQLFRIYPNPTSDFITLELNQTNTSSMAYIAIYNMNGKPILQQTMNGGSKRQFSLLGQPGGIYIVHVRSGSRSEIIKIIKN
jgi:hypothetical protein